MVRSTLLHIAYLAGPSGEKWSFYISRHICNLNEGIAQSFIIEIEDDQLPFQLIIWRSYSSCWSFEIIRKWLVLLSIVSSVKVTPKLTKAVFRAICGLNFMFSSIFFPQPREIQWCEALSCTSPIRPALRVKSEVSTFHVTSATSIEVLLRVS